MLVKTGGGYSLKPDGYSEICCVPWTPYDKRFACCRRTLVSHSVQKMLMRRVEFWYRTTTLIPKLCFWLGRYLLCHCARVWSLWDLKITQWHSIASSVFMCHQETTHSLMQLRQQQHHKLDNNKGINSS